MGAGIALAFLLCHAGCCVIPGANMVCGGAVLPWPTFFFRCAFALILYLCRFWRFLCGYNGCASLRPGLSMFWAALEGGSTP